MWLTQNPAGLCRQWIQSWMIYGSRLGMGIVCRREFVVVAAGPFWPAATGAPALRAAICG